LKTQVPRLSFRVDDSSDLPRFLGPPITGVLSPRVEIPANLVFPFVSCPLSFAPPLFLPLCPPYAAGPPLPLSTILPSPQHPLPLFGSLCHSLFFLLFSLFSPSEFHRRTLVCPLFLFPFRAETVGTPPKEPKGVPGTAIPLHSSPYLDFPPPPLSLALEGARRWSFLDFSCPFDHCLFRFPHRPYSSVVTAVVSSRSRGSQARRLCLPFLFPSPAASRRLRLLDISLLQARTPSLAAAHL